MKVYISVGTISLIVIPTIVFVQMEKWTTLESVYFGKSIQNCSWIPDKPFNLAFISLSTIGFGDMVPMVEPPLRYATFTKNDSACFNELVDPVPTSVRNDKTGLSELCNEVGVFILLERNSTLTLLFSLIAP